MTIKDWLRRAIAELAEVGIDTMRLDAFILLEQVLKKDRAQLLARMDTPLSSAQLKALNRLKHRRLKREPIAYIIGQKDFYGLDIQLDRRVLIPRPETEKLVEYIVRRAPSNSRVHDVGTGSGAIALALKSHRPDLIVTGSDLSKAALSLARSNARRLKLSVKFKQMNLLSGARGRYDVISANLPYLPAKLAVEPELRFEPRLALFAGRDGLKLIRQLLSDASVKLNYPGWLLLEHLPFQLKYLQPLAAGFKLQRLSPNVSVFIKLPPS
ncbi:MAG TPA: peptide chain release factor N(5)-glutamine methyltransferase [Candidatus Saccharimonadales bacterium]